MRRKLVEIYHLLTSPLHAFAHVQPKQAAPVLHLCLTCLLHMKDSLASSLQNHQRAHYGTTLTIKNTQACAPASGQTVY